MSRNQTDGSSISDAAEYRLFKNQTNKSMLVLSMVVELAAGHCELIFGSSVHSRLLPGGALIIHLVFSSRAREIHTTDIEENDVDDETPNERSQKSILAYIIQIL